MAAGHEGEGDQRRSLRLRPSTPAGWVRPRPPKMPTGTRSSTAAGPGGADTVRRRRGPKLSPFTRARRSGQLTGRRSVGDHRGAVARSGARHRAGSGGRPDRATTACRTCAPSRPRRSTSSGRWRPSSSVPCCLFSGGKDSIVMLHVAKKAFWPAPVPFPVMHVDTGRNFAEVLEFRDRHAAAARGRAGRGQGARRHRRRAHGGGLAGATRNRLQTPPCSGPSPRAVTTPSSAEPGGTRRRPGPRSGSSASVTSSASGTRRTNAQSCGTSTTPGTTRVSTSGSSRSPTGPSSTSGSTSATRRSTCPPSTTPTAARCSGATAC